jgi:glyoxylase-like metal-dependent hydrolase (beta-lactamase superfamily II)/rhodanese-related sulfurtransferase
MLWFRQYYLGCLSHASYLVGDTTTGRAVVVDPQRDIDEYLRDAEANGLRIERVIETHFHADFLSGHLELAEATGAVISYGEAAAGRAEYPIETLAHGQRLSLGEVELEIRATPGHTPESVSIVVWERPGDPIPYGVLTGDTLFIGDVGRPDLLVSIGHTAEDLGRMLYHSLHEQLLTLPDATRVFPAHGAGSACGKNLSTETQSTIGAERATNYALQPMTEDEFVAVVTEGQPAAPPYFLFAATRNRQQRALLQEQGITPMTLDEVLEAQRNGAAVLDTRDQVMFAAGHLRGSIDVGLDGRFAEYTGDVLAPDTPIVLVGEPNTESEARTRLARIGFDHVIGALDDYVAAFMEHPELVTRASRLTAEELAERRASVPTLQVVDIRNQGEIDETGTIPGAVNIPLPQLVARLGELDPTAPTVVYCAGGYRSTIAASTLRAKGFADVSDLLGGIGAWSGAGNELATAGTAS